MESTSIVQLRQFMKDQWPNSILRSYAWVTIAKRGTRMAWRENEKPREVENAKSDGIKNHIESAEVFGNVNNRLW